MLNPFKKKKKAYLARIADALRVNPRTILRALTGNPNEYWAPSHNPVIHLADVARIYNVSTHSLIALLNKEDSVLSPKEAADQLRVTKRTLRDNPKYTPLVTGAGFIRYSQNDVKFWAAELVAKEKDPIERSNLKEAAGLE